jgi:hypothetical protein
VVCPLCGQRRARRACPALGHQICTVCCGTKRVVQIECPADCRYLIGAEEHPPAAAIRQQQQDLDRILHLFRDLDRRQSQLLSLVGSFLARYDPRDLHRPIDQDVAEAAGALAATYETSARGLIYEHRPASLPSERLMTALKAILSEAGTQGGTPFDRDAALVLRRIEEAARQTDLTAASKGRAFLELLGRVTKKSGERSQVEGGEAPASRILIP